MSGLPRKKASAPRSEDELSGGSRIVAPGSIRTPDDSDALSVELSIDSFEVDLRSGREELGSWLTSTVTIRRIDATSFEFIAEGDRLIFTPDDPGAFGAHPAVAEPEVEKRGRRRKTEKAKKAKKADKAAKKADKAAKKADKASIRAEKRSARKAASDNQEPAASEPEDDRPRVEASPPASLEERTAAIKAKLGETSSEPEPTLSVDPETEIGEDSVALKVEVDVPGDEAGTPAEPHRQIRFGRKSKEERPGQEDEEPEESGDGLNRVWMHTIDIARKYDILGLDRVPIDEKLRGEEHVHTWDHRVAWKSGPGAHICTICGKVRLKTDQVPRSGAGREPEER